MVKGMYHYLGEAWKKPEKAVMQQRLIDWRASDSVERVEKPLRVDKARMLGYKAKTGFVIARVRVKRGGRTRPRFGVKGRKSTRQTIRKTLKMNYQWVAEIRAAKKFKNLEVLNSYYLAKDGKHYYYEIIMVDSAKPEISKDRTMKWISNGLHVGRAERGLTSAGKKSRGLRSRSRNMKVRPSLRAWNRKGK